MRVTWRKHRGKKEKLDSINGATIPRHPPSLKRTVWHGRKIQPRKLIIPVTLDGRTRAGCRRGLQNRYIVKRGYPDQHCPGFDVSVSQLRRWNRLSANPASPRAVLIIRPRISRCYCAPSKAQPPSIFASSMDALVSFIAQREKPFCHRLELQDLYRIHPGLNNLSQNDGIRSANATIYVNASSC
jgi:hypothetical protein